MDQPSIQQLYRDSFRPDEYINDYYQALDEEVQFFLLNLHNFFKSTSSEAGIYITYSTYHLKLDR